MISPSYNLTTTNSVLAGRIEIISPRSGDPGEWDAGREGEQVTTVGSGPVFAYQEPTHFEKSYYPGFQILHDVPIMRSSGPDLGMGKPSLSNKI